MRNQVNTTPATSELDSHQQINESRPQSSRRNNNYQKTHAKCESKCFEEEIPELAAVLGLQSEKLDKGVPFNQFQDKLKNYML